MNDHMNRKEIQERFADSAVAMFMEQYMTEIAEVADENAEDDSIEISEEFDRRGRKLIKKGLAKKQRQHAAKKLLRVAKVAVITIFILLGTFAILFTTVEAIRVPIINFFLDQKEGYLEISDEEIEVFAEDGKNVLEGLVPADYELEVFDSADTGDIAIIYVNPQDERIAFFAMPNTSTLQVDTEDAVVENTSVAGCEALLIDKNGYVLVWFSSASNQVRRLDARALSREEILALAEKIENLQ